MTRKNLILSIAVGAIGGVLLLPFVFGGVFSVISGMFQPKPTTIQRANLTFWNLFDEKDLYEGLIQQFQSSQPGVTVTYKKYTNIDDLETDLINELAEGKGPDIVSIDPSWVIKHKRKLRPMPPEFSLVFYNP